MFEKESNGMSEDERTDFVIALKRKMCLENGKVTDADVYFQGVKDGYNKANEWHYVKDGKDLPLEAGLHIRVVLHNGNEYICETDYYEPSEDEIGFGHLLIQLYSNNEWIDDNDVYAWCELSMPPKKE